jgi:hypothetical protein
MFTFVLKFFNSVFGFIVLLLILVPIGVHLTNPLTHKTDKSVAKPVAEKKSTTNVTKTSK